MHDLLSALNFLHRKKILHHDIKAANILATSKGEMKLTDFVIPTFFEDSFFHIKTIESLCWMAPEVIMGWQKNTRFHLIFGALAQLLSNLLKVQPPFAEYKPNHAMIEIKKHGFPGFRQGTSHSKEFQNFVNKCMIYDPNFRASINKLLNNPFVRQIEKLDRMKVLEDLIKVEIDFSKLVYDDEYEEEEEEEEPEEDDEPKEEPEKEEPKQEPKEEEPKPESKEEPKKEEPEQKKENKKKTSVASTNRSKTKKYNTRTQDPTSYTLKYRKLFVTFIQPSHESVNEIYAKKVDANPEKIE